MYRRSIVCCLFVILFAGMFRAQDRIVLPVQSPSRLSLRAASVEPVEGWRTMQVEHCRGERCTVWVSLTDALTENDIENAQPEVRADGYRAISVVFTDDGTNKLHDLTASQLKKLVAMVVDNKVLWAPMVTSVTPMAKSFPTANTGTLAGATPTGLTQEEVDLIMSILRPAQPR